MLAGPEREAPDASDMARQLSHHGDDRAWGRGSVREIQDVAALGLDVTPPLRADYRADAPASDHQVPFSPFEQERSGPSRSQSVGRPSGQGSNHSSRRLAFG